MRDCTAEAIKPALITAIQDRFGLPFFTEFIQAGYVSRENIINLPLGSQLLKLIPKDARVRYLEEPRLSIPPNETSGEETTLMKTFGSNFYESYINAKLIQIEALGDDEISNLPQADELKKTIIQGKNNLPFRYVEWVSTEGKAEFAYVFNHYDEREGMKRYYFRIVRPHTNNKGQADFISSYLPYIVNPLEEKALQERKEPCFIVEQECGRQKLVQILRPSASSDESFEDIFIGIVDQESGKCLVFNDIYPEVTFIQTSDKSRTGGYGAIEIGRNPNPICYLSSLDLGKNSGFLEQLVSGRLNPSTVVGHELGHWEHLRGVMEEGEKIYNSYSPAWGSSALVEMFAAILSGKCCG